MTYRIKWAFDPAGTLVAPSAAVKGNTYRCPGCGEALTFRAGAVKAKHFSHRAGGHCSGETALHAAAKWQVHAVANAFLAGAGPAPEIQGDCTGSSWWACHGRIRLPLNKERIDEVALECPVGEFRPDVLLLHKGNPRLAVEVLVTHAVEEAKSENLRVPWIELAAEDVMKDPIRWRPLQSSKDEYFHRCEFCRLVDLAALQKEVESIATRFHRWVSKARNPQSAQHSGWGENEIEKILARVRRETVTSWKAQHPDEPPAWDMDAWGLE